jgi:hypothetical protein
MKQRPPHPDFNRGELVGLMPWRRRRLEVPGFPAPLAGALAADLRIDLHALLELVDGGPPPQLAARILAPLEPPDSAA